jgi:hypothetical protein
MRGARRASVRLLRRFVARGGREIRRTAALGGLIAWPPPEYSIASVQFLCLKDDIQNSIVQDGQLARKAEPWASA